MLNFKLDQESDVKEYKSAFSTVESIATVLLTVKEG